MNEEHKKMTLLSAKPGVCAVCGVDHEIVMPHDQTSFFYQMQFYAKENRWPTWEDAMFHCTPEMQARWRAELQKRGLMDE